MKELRFIVSLSTRDNDFQIAQAAAAETAARELGVKVEISYAENDSIMQSTHLLQIIQGKPAARPAAILFQPAGGTAFPQVARAALACGIGWVILNRQADYLSSLRQLFASPIFSISTDHEEVGRIQGRQIAALLPQGGSALYIQGPSGSQASRERAAATESTKPANVRLILLRAQWTEQSAVQCVSSWLRLMTAQRAQIDLVVAQNDVMAIGARKAFESLIKHDREKWLSLPYIGCDGLPHTGQHWVRTKLLAATIAVPTNTDKALKILVRALRDDIQPPEKVLLAPCSLPPLERLHPQDVKEPHI